MRPAAKHPITFRSSSGGRWATGWTRARRNPILQPYAGGQLPRRHLGTENGDTSPLLDHLRGEVLCASRTVASLAVPKKQTVEDAGPAATQLRACEGCWRCADRPNRSISWSGPIRTRFGSAVTSRYESTHSCTGETDRLVEEVRLLTWQIGVQGPAGLQPFLGEEEIAAAGETRDPLRVGVIDEPDGFRDRPPHHRHSLGWEAWRRAVGCIDHVAREQDGRHHAPGVISMKRGPSVSSMRACIGGIDGRDESNPGDRRLSPGRDRCRHCSRQSSRGPRPRPDRRGGHRRSTGRTRCGHRCPARLRTRCPVSRRSTTSHSSDSFLKSVPLHRVTERPVAGPTVRRPWRRAPHSIAVHVSSGSAHWVNSSSPPDVCSHARSAAADAT